MPTEGSNVYGREVGMCMIRWIGAMCVVGACGACGFSMAASYRGLEKNLQQLGNALELMECQMEYRLTELPELCSILASACTGTIGQIFAGLGRQLQSGLVADAAACMNLTLEKYPDLPKAGFAGAAAGLGCGQGECPADLGQGAGGKIRPAALLPGPGPVRRRCPGHLVLISLWMWISSSKLPPWASLSPF